MGLLRACARRSRWPHRCRWPLLGLLWRCPLGRCPPDSLVLLARRDARQHSFPQCRVLPRRFSCVPARAARQVDVHRSWPVSCVLCDRCVPHPNVVRRIGAQGLHLGEIWCHGPGPREPRPPREHRRANLRPSLSAGDGHSIVATSDEDTFDGDIASAHGGAGLCVVCRGGRGLGLAPCAGIRLTRPVHVAQVWRHRAAPACLRRAEKMKENTKTTKRGDESGDAVIIASRRPRRSCRLGARGA